MSPLPSHTRTREAAPVTRPEFSKAPRATPSGTSATGVPGESVLPGTPTWGGASTFLVLAKLVAEATSLPVTMAGKGVSESGVSPDTLWRGSRVTRSRFQLLGSLDVT